MDYEERRRKKGEDEEVNIDSDNKKKRQDLLKRHVGSYYGNFSPLQQFEKSKRSKEDKDEEEKKKRDGDDNAQTQLYVFRNFLSQLQNIADEEKRRKRAEGDMDEKRAITEDMDFDAGAGEEDKKRSIREFVSGEENNMENSNEDKDAGNKTNPETEFQF